jgi:hypothetical protein
MSNSEKNQEEITEVQPKNFRIAKSTGKPDRRSITSKENARFAGKQKLQKLKNEQNDEHYQIVEQLSASSSSDSDSDDNVLVLKQKSGKGKQKKKPIVDNNDYLKQEIDNLKNMIQSMSKKKKKTKTKIIKVVDKNPSSISVQLPISVQSSIPIQPSLDDQKRDHIKKKILSF